MLTPCPAVSDSGISILLCSIFVLHIIYQPVGMGIIVVFNMWNFRYQNIAVTLIYWDKGCTEAFCLNRITTNTR